MGREGVQVLIRGQGTSEELLAIGQQILRDLDPDMAVIEAKTMNEHLALTLAAIGIYGCGQPRGAAPHPGVGDPHVARGYSPRRGTDGDLRLPFRGVAERRRHVHRDSRAALERRPVRRLDPSSPSEPDRSGAGPTSRIPTTHSDHKRSPHHRAPPTQCTRKNALSALNAEKTPSAPWILDGGSLRSRESCSRPS